MFPCLTLGPVNPTPGSPLGPAAPTGPRSPCVNRNLSNHNVAGGRWSKGAHMFVCFFFCCFVLYLLSLKTRTSSPKWTRNAWRPLVTLIRQSHIPLISEKHNHQQHFFKKHVCAWHVYSWLPNIKIIFILRKRFALRELNIQMQNTEKKFWDDRLDFWNKRREKKIM